MAEPEMFIVSPEGKDCGLKASEGRDLQHRMGRVVN